LPANYPLRFARAVPFFDYSVSPTEERALLKTVCHSLLIPFLCIQLALPVWGAQWVWQNPLPQGHTLSSVQLLDDSHGWAAGRDGVLLHTLDGGATWNVILTDGDLAFENFVFLDSSNGWAITGIPYRLLRTTDGGRSWTTVPTVDNPPPLDDLHFHDGQHGWIASETQVLRTTDAGLTWHAHETHASGTLAAIAFPDPLNGWAIANHFPNGASILHTTDGGLSWSPQTVAVSLDSTRLSALHFVDAMHGWAVGLGGQILHTANGGADWSPQSSGLGIPLSDVFFIDSMVGWIVTSNWTLEHGYQVLHTTNGGADWSPQATGAEQATNLLALHFANATDGLLVGESGILFNTINGGADWVARSSGPNDDFLDVDFSDSQSGIAVGTGNYLYLTENGGNSWQNVPIPPEDSKEIARLTHVWKLLSNYFAGLVGATKKVIKVEDKNKGKLEAGDLTFIYLDPGVAGDIEALYGVDDLTWWIATNAGEIRRTTNGGESWDPQASGVERSLNGFHFHDGLIGWVVGEQGTILKTTDGGDNWFPQPSGTASNLNAVHFFDTKRGFAVGDGGRYLTTDNGGDKWEIGSLSVFHNLHDIAFADALHGWIVGSSTRALYTDDGGQTWTSQPTGASGLIWAVDAPDPDHAWIVGAGGAILHYDGATDSSAAHWQLLR